MYDTFGKGAVTVLVIFVAGMTAALFLLTCCWYVVSISITAL